MQRDLILKEFEDLKGGVRLLKASVKKFSPYDTEKIYTPDELEYYDSLSFRFEKCVELALIFFKGMEIYLYSKGSDTLRDRLLKMQKLNFVEDIEFWMSARLLRNKISHTYIPEQIKDIYQEIKERSQTIFDSIDRVEKYMGRLSEKKKRVAKK